MLDSEEMISGGTFLLSFTYCSNCVISERLSTSASRPLTSSTSISSQRAAYSSSVSTKASMRARCTPSTSTLIVPSGSFRSCRIFDTVPTT